MKIEITNTNRTLDYKFGEWIIEVVSNEIKSNIDEKKLIRWNEYLNTDGVLKFTSRKSILAKEIIYLGIDNLRLSELPNRFIIEINPNKYVPGVDKVKVVSACKLINYGNATMKGYPIFSNSFEMVVQNIDSLIEIYLRQKDGGGENRG